METENDSIKTKQNSHDFEQTGMSWLALTFLQ